MLESLFNKAADLQVLMSSGIDFLQKDKLFYRTPPMAASENCHCLDNLGLRLSDHSM